MLVGGTGVRVGVAVGRGVWVTVWVGRGVCIGLRVGVTVGGRVGARVSTGAIVAWVGRVGVLVGVVLAAWVTTVGARVAAPAPPSPPFVNAAIATIRSTSNTTAPAPIAQNDVGNGALRFEAGTAAASCIAGTRDAEGWPDTACCLSGIARVAGKGGWDMGRAGAACRCIRAARIASALA